MSAGKIILVIVGAIAALAGLALSAAGAVLLGLHATQRDADGFFTSPEVRLVTEDHALTTDDIDFGARPGDWFPDRGELTFRFEVTATDEDQPIFIGIADQDDVDAFLDDVAHERIRQIRLRLRDVTYDHEPGSREPGPPGDQAFWVASSEGVGATTLTWDAERGEWAVVIMDADGDRGVAVLVTAGARFGLLRSFALAILLVGLVVMVLAVVLLVVAIRRPLDHLASSRDDTAPGPYPLVLRGRLDEDLSRWFPLVKWLLAIPHIIVLVFLWAAFVVLTVVAGFAILFTGRYPVGIFQFNVGVLRWTWRVSYWSYGALGTDRYPPFSLAPDPDYPADLHVEYPQRLSQGLVLVKSWLLAIPHWLIVGMLTSGVITWSADGGPGGADRVNVGTGVIGLLVLIVAFALLFTGRYPAGLHQLIVGCQRWVFRVGAYVALMTDQYPPFRLDMGGEEALPDAGSGEVVKPPEEPL